jgi:hypothetical protein
MLGADHQFYLLPHWVVQALCVSGLEFLF